MATTFNQALDDQNVSIDTTAHAAIILLLSAKAFPVRDVTYYKATADANTLTLQPATGELIAGAANLVVTTMGAVTIKPIGGGWMIVSQSAVTSTGGGGGTGGPLTLQFAGAMWAAGVAFTGGFTATGGAGGYVFSIHAGSLPGWAALNGSTGKITGTPVIGVYTFTGRVTDSASATADLAVTITVTATAPPDATVGAETPNCSGLTAVPIFELAMADGGEAWQLVTNATPPADSRFAYAQAVYCPTAMFRGSGTAGTDMASTSSGYAGGNITVIVTPWAAASIVNVSGADITWVSGPKFNTALSPTDHGNYVSVNGQMCRILTNTDDQHATLTFAPTAQGSNKVFIPQEARYGGIQDSGSSQVPSLDGVSGHKGDTVIIDSEQFTVVTESGSLDSAGNSTWTLYRTPGAHPAHTASALNLTTGAWTTSTYIIDIAGLGVKFVGEIHGSDTQGVSDVFPMGDPAAATIYMVSVSTLGVINTWPVPGVTPQATPFLAETQTLGSLSASRLKSTELGVGFSGGSGNPVVVNTQNFSGSQINNGSFDLLPLGSGWSAPTGAGVASYPSSGAHTGSSCLKVSAAATTQISQQAQDGTVGYVKVVPGDQWLLSAWTKADSGTTGQCILFINYFNASKGYLSTSTGILFNTSTTWTEVSLVFTVPANAAYALVYAANVQIAGSGNWYVDDISYTHLPAVTGAVGLDSSGNLIINTHSIDNGMLVAPAGSTGATGYYYGSYSQFTRTGSTTAGFSSLVMSSVTSLVAGQTINGPGIPPGTVINSIFGSTVTMSQAATDSFSSQSYNFTALPSTAGFPSGAYLFNVIGSLGNNAWILRAGKWINTSDPGTIIAGQVITNLLIAGSAIVGTLTAVTVQSSTWTNTGTNFSLTVDDTNAVLLTATGGTFAGTTVQLDPNQFGLVVKKPSGSTSNNGLYTSGGATVSYVDTFNSANNRSAELGITGVDIYIGASAFPAATLGGSLLMMKNLPSSNPGAGSKQFWYDPADGNRVKFAA